MKVIFSVVVLLSTLSVSTHGFKYQTNSKFMNNAKIREKKHSMAMISSLPELISHSQYLSDALHHISMPATIDSALQHSMILSDDAVANVAEKASTDVSVYSKVDKTGFIGFLADYVERIIDFSHGLIKGLGIENSYGYAIILFTFFVKFATYPLSSTQIESTTKLQKLTPLQQKIQAKFANNEQLKNQYLAQLYQVSNVNPLAGCFPALVQIPVFISLYRALQNLVAENKLDESFLWIPNLEGPSFMNPPSQSLDWLKSAFTGNPSYGWPDTIAYLSIPITLFISQSISQKILQPPRDPNKVLTEQEEINQFVLNLLPVMVASFSINVPAGLGVYWVVNNIVTTLVTLYIKNSVKNEALPPEVDQLMAMIDSNVGASKPASKVSGAYQELFGNANNEVKRTSVGFGRSESAPVINTTAEISSVSDDPAEANAVDDESEALAEVEVQEASGDDSKKKKRAVKKEKRRR